MVGWCSMGTFNDPCVTKDLFLGSMFNLEAFQEPIFRGIPRDSEHANTQNLSSGPGHNNSYRPGKRLFYYGKSPLWMGKSTISTGSFSIANR